jgi:hypothetical protein
MIGDGSSANVFNSEALMLHASCRRSIARLLMNRSRYTRTSAASDSDLPLNFHPAALRASAGLVCSPTLDRRKVEFSGLCQAGGLDTPAGVMREAGGLLPIAPCGRSSL